MAVSKHNLKKARNTCSNLKRNSIYKKQKVARITTNGYLNYLREFKQQFCGLSPRDMVRFGALEWNKLMDEEKKIYKNLYKQEECAAEVLNEEEQINADESNYSSSETSVPIKMEVDESSSVLQLESSVEIQKSQKADNISLPDECGSEEICLLCRKDIGSSHHRHESPETKNSDLFSDDLKLTESSQISLENAWLAKETKRLREKECSKVKTKSKPSKSKGKDKVCKSRKTHKNDFKHDKGSLGSASAYINFMKSFVKQYGNVKSKQLIKSAAYHWSKLKTSERAKFENPSFMQFKKPRKH
ncbi:protamine-like protein 99C [Drosophila bipectinata]|uniref:protamine-like protein 99C n=1 Tax=Drosophila bipectinata TaxID=42026 RepID=UPI001C88E287|nr:uncharacterized protein LOC108134424 [Drosophila bipectinata]